MEVGKKNTGINYPIDNAWAAAAMMVAAVVICATAVDYILVGKTLTVWESEHTHTHTPSYANKRAAYVVYNTCIHILYRVFQNKWQPTKKICMYIMSAIFLL